MSTSINRAAALAVTVVIVLAPVQDVQCEDKTWAKLHPQICYKYTGPFDFGGGGGGGGRGIIGRILDRIPGVGGLL